MLFERNVGLRHAVATPAATPGPVMNGEADIIAALVALHRRALCLLEPADSASERCGPCRDATSAISATTAEAVASPPAPGPIRVSSFTASASIVTALVTPITWAIAEVFGTIVGCTRCSMPHVGALGNAEQLDAVAELRRPCVRSSGRDRRDALDVDRVGVDLGAEGEARQDGELVGGVEALDVEGRIGLRIAEALRVREAVVRRSGPRAPCAIRM